MDDLTGTTLGNYEIGEELRRDPGRVTYRAIHRGSGRTVRLDVIPPIPAAQSAVGNAFLQQTAAAAQLVHPDAATVYDAGIVNLRPFVVSQYLDAPDLSSLLPDESWTPERSVAVLNQIASVLDEAHRLNIVHGDIRPSNVQIRSDDRAFITGFGVHEDVTQASDSDRDRALWATPEQIQGSTVSTATDIYQLGTLAYYLLAGSAPYDRSSTQEIFDAHQNDFPIPVHELNTNLNPQVSLIIQTAMARQPDNRFSTAIEFTDQLASAINYSDQIFSTPTSVAPPAGPVSDATVELFPKRQQRRRREVIGRREDQDVRRPLTRMGLVAGGCLMVLLVVLGAGIGAATAVDMIGSEEDPTPTTPENIVIYATFTATPTLEPRPTRTLPPPLPTPTSTATSLPTASPTGGNSSAQSTLPPLATAPSTSSPAAQPTATQTAQPSPTLEPTREPSPTPSPTKIPAPSPPKEAQIQYDRPLNEWRNDEFPQGWIRPATSTLRIGVYGDSTGQTMQGWTAVDDWEDISVSVDLRATTTGLDAVGCVALRHDVDQGEYQLCMFATGETWATYNFFSSSQGWQTVELLEVEERSETRPPQSWNTLKIIAEDDEFWFYANGQLLGFAEHSGRDEGSAAIQVTNWDQTDAEFEFRNLTVRSLN